jgi:hypothetical protein
MSSFRGLPGGTPDGRSIRVRSCLRSRRLLDVQRGLKPNETPGLTGAAVDIGGLMFDHGDSDGPGFRAGRAEPLYRIDSSGSKGCPQSLTWCLASVIQTPQAGKIA